MRHDPSEGERFKNPGNLPKGGAWAGLSKVQPAGELAAFMEPIYGVAALAQSLTAAGLAVEPLHVRAVIEHEQGRCIYSDDLIERAVALAAKA